jgi:two-component system, OmpR family, alkaline phosphatase synthesis response regulator PhoP
MTKRDFTILLVDDETDILEVLSYNLNREGYKVYTSADGLDGFEKAKKFKPQLMVLDLMLPGIDGIELCEQIRSVDALKNSAIIILTARSEDYSQIAGYNAGADDYIIKPVAIKVFMHKIKVVKSSGKKFWQGIKKSPSVS